MLIGQASAQWWVQGGNLFWPYGDVTIQKDLNVGMGLTINDSIYFVNDSTKIYNHRFYEEGEFSENNISFNLLTSTTNDLFILGNAGFSYKRNGILYSNLSVSGFITSNAVGSFALINDASRGAIQYTRSSDSYVLKILVGSGTPEGSVSARVGSIYLRTDGGAGTSFYVKESGVSTTGWVGK